mgnify:CR=1 FL=1
MENTLVVKNMDGQDIRINVIDIIEDTELNKEYICYTIEDMEDVYISLIENETEDSYSLGAITEEEKAVIEQVLAQRGE